ncbi:MAG: hypothetical protein H8M99_01985 [Gloeobacteraceae cyanobacterium ES-bin-144]|nr:hypothetical protein [Verrucomicrobiales bacterium]
MNKSFVIKMITMLILVLALIFFYLTEFQKYRIRSTVEAARIELISGRMDFSSFGRLDTMINNAVLPSVEKYGEIYLNEYSRSGDPEKFATGVRLDRPRLDWANGIGKSYTIPISIMLLEKAKNYPPKTKAYMEEIACTLLPKATRANFGIIGKAFVESEEERSRALKQWRDWFEENKYSVLQDDQRRKAEVEALIDKQKQFVKGVMELSQ